MSFSPAFESLVRQMGEVGLRLREIDSAEGRAGNMSVPLSPEHLEGLELEPGNATMPLPGTYPLLSDSQFLVTGSGRRLWQILDDPAGNLCIVRISSDGKTYEMLWGKKRGLRPTSELNSHLGIFQVRQEIGQPIAAVIHAQPLHTTALSHAAEFQDPDAFNRAVYGWQPETIVLIPEGIGLVPYQLPGSADQEEATAAAFRAHRIVVWAKHGVVSIGPDLWSAFDLIDCVEIVARYYYLNRMAGLTAAGLSTEQLAKLCERFKVKSPMVERRLAAISHKRSAESL